MALFQRRRDAGSQVRKLVTERMEADEVVHTSVHTIRLFDDDGNMAASREFEARHKANGKVETDDLVFDYGEVGPCCLVGYQIDDDEVRLFSRWNTMEPAATLSVMLSQYEPSLR